MRQGAAAGTWFPHTRGETRVGAARSRGAPLSLEKAEGKSTRGLRPPGPPVGAKVLACARRVLGWVIEGAVVVL